MELSNFTYLFRISFCNNSILCFFWFIFHLLITYRRFRIFLLLSSDIASFARAYILISFIDRTSSRTAGQSRWDLLLLDSDNPRGGVMDPLRPPEKACSTTCSPRKGLSGISSLGFIHHGRFIVFWYFFYFFFFVRSIYSVRWN